VVVVDEVDVAPGGTAGFGLGFGGDVFWGGRGFALACGRRG